MNQKTDMFSLLSNRAKTSLTRIKKIDSNEYPELDKYKTRSRDIRLLENFLIALRGRWGLGLGYMETDQVFTQSYISTQKIILDYFGIDQQKLDVENNLINSQIKPRTYR